MAGTLRKNKREIPLNLHGDTRQQPLYSLRFLFTQKDGIMILYYKAKQKKDVFLLSSLHTTPVVDDSDSKKPEAILHYNATKGGVDTAYEMLRCYSTRAASWRWPLAAFFDLVDINYMFGLICDSQGYRHDAQQ